MAPDTPSRIVGHQPDPGDLVILHNDLEVIHVSGRLTYTKETP